MNAQKSKKQSDGTRSRRGSAIAIALIFITMLSILVGVTLRFSGTEFRINSREILRSQALYSTESVLELGFSEIDSKLSGVSNFSPFFLQNDGEITDVEVKEVAPDSDYVDYDFIDAEIGVGLVPPGVRNYIDPSDPINEKDALKGQWVITRNVILVAKTTIRHPTVGEITTYAKQRLEIRDSPLFAYAIFYDGTMALYPGPYMFVDGPVHGNSDVWIRPHNGMDLKGNFSTAGDYLYMTGAFGDNRWGYGNSFNFMSPNGLRSAKWNIDGRNTFWDSSFDDYSVTTALFNRFGEFVQTADNDITPYKPLAFEPLSEAGKDLSMIIEPPVKKSEVSLEEWALFEPFEDQKFSNKAALVFEVDVNVINEQSGTVEYDLQKDSEGVDHLTFTETDPFEIDKDFEYDIDPYEAAFHYLENLKADTNETTIKAYVYSPSSSGDYKREDGTYRRVDVTNQINDTDTPLFDEGNPDSIFKTKGPEDPLVIYDIGSRDYVDDIATIDALGDDFGEEIDTAVADSDLDADLVPLADAPIKMWDARKRQWVHKVEMNVGNLKNALDAGNLPDWNGIVYVEFKRDGKLLGEYDERTNPTRTGLRLTNAEELPSETNSAHEGFTIATNNTVYIRGNYNADGDINTGTALLPDDISDPADILSTEEPPAAIAADSIYALSDNWNDTMSRADVRRQNRNGNNPSRYHFNNHRNIPDDIEISAALLSGVASMEEEDMGWYYPGSRVASNGGPMNYVQMLEFMQKPQSMRNELAVLRLRTSMVQLFESSIMWQPHMKRYNMRPPQRDYGFRADLAEGIYPPGTPTVRSFRRVFFREISPAEYKDTKTLIDNVNSSGLTIEEYESALDEIHKKYEG